MSLFGVTMSKSSGDAKPRCIHLPKLWSPAMACMYIVR